MNVETLVYWINERETIRCLKDQGQPKPWSADPIFQSYRFCNVNRENDTVTRWINDHWRVPYADHPNLWFAMCLSRQINLPETLEEIGFPVKWYPNKVRSILLARGGRGEKVYTGAYMLRGNVQKGGDKAQYIVDNMTVLFESKDKPRYDDTLASYHSRLMLYPGWGSFLAAQAVADLKHTSWLEHASDWHSWCAPGPGSVRGLNYVMERPVNTTIGQAQFLEEVTELRRLILPRLLPQLRSICLQDLQNCLCEYHKYEKTIRGEGRPRSRYEGMGVPKTD